MDTVITIIKKALLDLRDEILYLLIFNLIWAVGTFPALSLLSQALLHNQWGIFLLGLIALLPWPFVTFGLVFIAYDIGLAKGITFKTFFIYAWRFKKQAYIWGTVNIAVLFLFGINIRFYAKIESAWIFYLQILVITTACLWGILQLVALPMYPRLKEPTFKLALRNAVIAGGRYPKLVFSLAAIAILLIFGSSFVPTLYFALTVSVIALLADRTVEVIIARDQKDLEKQS